MIKTVRRDDRGFTLVELIVAIVILAIVVVPLLNSFVVGAKTQRSSSLKNSATLAAQSVMEDIEAADPEALLAGCTKNLAADRKTVASYTKTVANPGSASALEARVTLTPVSAVNSKKVVVSNRMDAIIDMSGADEDSLNEFSAKCDGHVAADVLQKALNKTIDIVSSKNASDNTYTVTVTFRYSGSTSYTLTETREDGTTIYTNVPVSYSNTVTDSATVAAPETASLQSMISAKKPAFSLYVYFSPILRVQATYYGETFNIKNSNGDGLDFNVFLIDVSPATTAVNYRPNISYSPQNDTSVPRVFTNLVQTGSYARIYHASSPTGSVRDITIDGTLAEKRPVDRMFSVTVSVGQAGAADTSVPLVTLSGVKLG